MRCKRWSRGMVEQNRLTGEALLDLYKGTFLHKSESPWASSLADHLEQRFMLVAHEHAVTLEVKDAIRVYEKILSINETDETAWQGLIQNYVLDGQEQQAK
jgi:two-component SAPR family response regulator